jgi:hypothetical protein
LELNKMFEMEKIQEENRAAFKWLNIFHF